MNKALLKIKPVGGVGQIGSNMTLIQGANDTILIDAGILFPYEDFFDINYLIPCMDNIPTPSHLVITHGHEDHIGAIDHVVKKFPNIKIHISNRFIYIFRCCHESTASRPATTANSAQLCIRIVAPRVADNPRTLLS